MKKIKDLYRFLRIFLKSQNYIIIGISESKNDPEKVDLNYQYYANIDTMISCFVEIAETEKGKNRILNEAKQILK